MNLQHTSRSHDGDCRTVQSPRPTRLFTLLFTCLLAMLAGQGYAQDVTPEDVARWRTAANQGYAEAKKWYQMVAEQGDLEAVLMHFSIATMMLEETDDETSASVTTSIVPVTSGAEGYPSFFPVYGVLLGKTTIIIQV